MNAARALAFADLTHQTWGVAWISDGQPAAPVAVGVGSSSRVFETQLVAGAEAGDDDSWQLEGHGLSLRFSPEGRFGHGGDEASGIETLEQLGTVSGQLALPGGEQPVRCSGWRAVIESELEPEAIGSFRVVCGWFDPGEAISLVALRPSKARGHDADRVAATVLDAQPGPRVADPRLSTAYTPRGLPYRAGVELWFEEESSDQLEDPPAHPYPRRASGQAVGLGIGWAAAGFDLHAELFRWHARGQEGPGIYLLGRRG